ncbi:DUF4817 domain-containing protein [Trichonephila clavipes]|uniref:DUF4817 domain-containing protein n=1 Tax=Trichonephila clavipes TaxID=2585209 RepID=A0A8X6V137_TRICX|nr:DUF4817 domain-containing protein [Trichonephila clavipes]
MKPRFSGILPEKAQEHIEDSQRNITSCRNEVGTLGTKDEEVTAEMDKGIMVADSFSEQECCAELALGLRAGVKKFCESCKESQLTGRLGLKTDHPVHLWQGLNCHLSDEAHFWLNGYVNKQNCRIWSEANPQVYVETPLHPEKLTVWCTLWAGGIIGPYFFKNDEGHNVTVNGDR